MAAGLGAYLDQLLSRTGLESLAPWVLEMILSGASPEQIELDLEDQPAFKAAFPEVAARQARAKELGISLPPISALDVIDYRSQARQMMRSWGVPPGMWDSNADIATWIIGDVSLDELNGRMELASTRVMQAPPEVRAMFDELTGFHGDQALFTMFLDPEKAPPILEDWVQKAEFGGAARRFGFQLERDRIEEAARYNISYGQAIEGFGALDEMRSLFDESIFEEGVDFTVEEEGISAVFGLEGGATEKLKRRAETRTAQTAGGSGGITEERGVTSLGGAGRR
jgi:hypothetical protein